MLASTTSAQSNELAVPAEYLFELNMPGTMNEIARPARIYTDHEFSEVYVADRGNARVLIFDETGVFQFEFSVSEYCGSPMDLAVSSEGFIYVLGSVRRGVQVLKFDYDGLYLGDFATFERDQNKQLNIQSIAIDGRDRIYILDESVPRIIRYTPDGTIDLTFSITRQVSESEQLELVFGSLFIDDGHLYVPASSMGMVYRYTLDGELVGRIGHKGSKVGELNFPVGVTLSSEDIVLVLDKHRYNVLAYSLNGNYLGEFGGKGINPGWFYHPTWLAIDSKDQVYIGQIFNNKVQAVRIPDFIIERHSQLQDQAVRHDKQDQTIGSANNNYGKTVRRWSRRNALRPTDCVSDSNLERRTDIQTTLITNPLISAFIESVGGNNNA